MNESTEPPEHLPRELALRLLAHAQQAPERRVCGLVSADGTGPAAFWPLHNSAADPAKHAAVDGEQLAAQHAALTARGQTLWGSFHSCPRGLAGAADLAIEGVAAPRRLIAALDIRGVLQLRCFAGTRECALKLKE